MCVLLSSTNTFSNFQHLASLLIVTQLLGQMFESVVPYMVYKRRKKEIKEKAKSKEGEEGIELLTPASGISPDAKLHAEIEAAKEEFAVSMNEANYEQLMNVCSARTPSTAHSRAFEPR